MCLFWFAHRTPISIPDLLVLAFPEAERVDAIEERGKDLMKV